MLIQVEYKNLCFGIIAQGERVIAAAPCASWAIGHRITYVLASFFRKGATITAIESPEKNGFTLWARNRYTSEKNYSTLNMKVNETVQPKAI